MVTLPNTAYGHDTALVEKLMTINPPVNATAVRDAKDTYRQIATTMPHKISPVTAPSGVITSAAPNAGATPRPPLKLAKMGQLCPAITARPEAASMAGYCAKNVLLDIIPLVAMNTGSAPFRTSAARTMDAIRGPSKRRAFVDPVLPLPWVRISMPRNFPAINPDGIDPIR